MTKEEWLAQYREVRKNRTRLDFGEINRILKRIYGIHLHGKDKVKFDLIEMYETKVSDRLKAEYKELEKKGKKQADELWQNVINSRFGGTYVKVPLGN